MYRDILTYKWILGGVGFLIMFAAGCMVWYQHDIADEKKVVVDAEELHRQSKKAKKVADTDGKAEQAAGVESAESDTKSAKKPVTKTTPVTKDTELTQVDVPTETAEAADVLVSPHGFGPFPEVPKAYFHAVEIPPWKLTEFYGAPPASRNQELMARVMVKLWKEGNTTVEGVIVLPNGRFRVNYKNRAYVRYSTRKTPDGRTIPYIAAWSSGSLKMPSYQELLQGYIPSGVELIDLDQDNPTIDPYEFLGLPR
ncbi:hypothetical protein JT359_17365 [Candidatus Poribacteria bacterium]|nr:hypothetical protein [Candidatus Poribacteria bacterium]